MNLRESNEKQEKGLQNEIKSVFYSKALVSEI